MSEAKAMIFEAMSELCGDEAVMRAEMVENCALPEMLVAEVDDIVSSYNDDEEVWELVCDTVYRYDNELSKYFY